MAEHSADVWTVTVAEILHELEIVGRARTKRELVAGIADLRRRIELDRAMAHLLDRPHRVSASEYWNAPKMGDTAKGG